MWVCGNSERIMFSMQLQVIFVKYCSYSYNLVVYSVYCVCKLWKTFKLFTIITYNSQFHNIHPPIHLVISVLKETQRETETIILSINKGREKSVAKKDLHRIYLTIQSYNNYKNHQNVIQYLKKNQLSLQGEKI